MLDIFLEIFIRIIRTLEKISVEIFDCELSIHVYKAME